MTYKTKNRQQKTILTDGFSTSSLTRFVNTNELNLRTDTNLSQLPSIVKSENCVDPTGIEPVRPEFLGPAPKPGGPTLPSLLHLQERRVKYEAPA